VSRLPHGKVAFGWCDGCGTLILGEECAACGSEPRRFRVSAPGDIRPCFGEGVEVVRSIFERYLGHSSFLSGRLVFLNKIAGEDRADEIIVEGHVIGAMRFDLRKGDFRLDLRLDGARMLADHSCNGLVWIRPPAGHIKGRNLAGENIVGRKGRFQEGDPLVVVSGDLVCAGVARCASDQISAGKKAIGIREVGRGSLHLPERRVGWDAFVRSNLPWLERLEAKAVSDIRSFLGNSDLPVTLSFSGGKDSLACYGVTKRAAGDFVLLFVNTGLEFPETVDYVRRFADSRDQALLEANAGEQFWEQLDAFGPPAKDYRWCCKVCKLAPLTRMIEEHYPGGCITVEGNRALESFSRLKMGFVERNPFVPNQVVLNPIKDWRAAEVWAYIWWRDLPYNPLYDQDLERIGCYLCPSCLASEWRRTREIHPELYAKWDRLLREWAEEVGAGPEFIDLGFWRWKVLPPKMERLAREIDLRVPALRADRIELDVVKGVSPCTTGGYSVEGVLRLPMPRGFAKVAEMLHTLGAVRYSDEFNIVLVRAGPSTLKVFGGGQMVATAPGGAAAERLFRQGAKTLLRSQLCSGCGICIKSCPSGAITVDGVASIDSSKCSHCGRCLEVCVVAHYHDKIVG